MQVGGLPEPGDAAGVWRRILSAGAGLLGGILAATALIFWVAANWPHLGPAARLWLALTVLLAAGACWRRSRWAAPLTGLAALMTGAPLAIVGQIYQAAANPWPLFAWWAVLILPWLLVQRTVFLTLLWATLLNLALWHAADPSFTWAFWPDEPANRGVLAAAALNGVLLLAAEALRPRWHDPRRAVPRVLAAALLGCVLWAAAYWVFDGPASWSAWVALWLALLVFGGLYGVYRWVRRDLALVALTGLATIALLGAWVARTIDSLSGIFLLALLLFVLGFFAVRHLLRLSRGRTQAAPVGDGTAPPASSSAAALEPGYVSALRIGVLLPVVALLSIGVLIGLDLVQAEGVMGLGVAALLVGLGLERGTAGAFGQDVASVLNLLGLGLIFGSVLGLMGADYTLVEQLAVVCLAGGVTYGLSQRFAVRFLVACLTLGTALWLIMPAGLWDFSAGSRWQVQAALRVAACLFLGTAAWVGSQRPAWRSAGRPAAWALLLLAASPVVWPDSYNGGPGASGLPAVRFLLLACALLPGVLLVFWLRQTAPGASWVERLGPPALLCLAAPAWAGAPGFSVALTCALLGYWAGSRPLQAVAIPVGLSALVLYYQQAQPSLVNKAWPMALAALALIALAAASRVRTPRSKRPAASTGLAWRAPLIVLAGGAFVLGATAYQVHGYERALATGQRVVLELAPVDPRAPLRGDYMALHYAVQDAARRQLRAMRGDWPLGGTNRGWLVLRPDAAGVARLVGVEARRPTLRPREVALAFRLVGMQPVFGADAWFFAEGRGPHYADARYGVLKVSDDGKAMLAELLDAQRRPL